MHNHPYLGASHSLDIAVIVPIFARRRADRLLGQHRAPPRHRRRLAGRRGRPVRHVRRGPHLQRDVHRPRGRPRRQHVVLLRGQQPRAARGHGRPVLPDRRGPARRAPPRRPRREALLARRRGLLRGADRLLRAHAACRDRQDPRRPLPRRGLARRRRHHPRCAREARGHGDRRGRRRDRRPHRVTAAARQRAQHPLRRLDAGRRLQPVPHAAARHVPHRRLRAGQLGRLPAHHGHRARGLHLQPALPRRDADPLQPDQPRRRPDPPGAGARHARPHDGGQLGAAQRHVHERDLRRRQLLDHDRGRRGLLRRASREGRDGRGRLPVGEHPQPADRGHRDAPAVPLLPLRADRAGVRARRVARRHQRGARLRVPDPLRRHDRVRAPRRHRPAPRRLRRHLRAARPLLASPAPTAHASRCTPRSTPTASPPATASSSRASRAAATATRWTASPPASSATAWTS